MKNRTLTYGMLALAVIAVIGLSIVHTNAPFRLLNTSPAATSTPTVTLADGESYTLTMGPVNKTIGDHAYSMYAYNGSIPGPVLRVKKGAHIAVTVVNNTDTATTLHAHGVRMENAFDGVPDLTQKPIAPGESFTYELTFPDAGTFWYHPHVRTDATVEKGLYGAIVVEDDAPVTTNRDEVVVLDDLLLQGEELAAFSPDVADHALMGRFGNVLLTNGSTDYHLSAKKGEVIRMHFVNAANARPFNVTIPGARIKIIGSDGGVYSREFFVESVMLSPGERVVADVLFNTAGTYPIEHRTPARTYTLGSVAVSDEAVPSSFAAAFENRETHDIGVSAATIAALRDRAADKSVRLTMSMHGMNGMGGDMQGMHMMHGGSMMQDSMMPRGNTVPPIEWEDTMQAMNAQSTSQTMTWQMVDEASGKVNMEIADWNFTQGDIVKIKVTNDPNSRHPMQHPIHFHGQRFLVLSVNGVPNDTLVWKDTALVPAGQTVELAVEMSNPGTWMAHCHILEHAESGMMLPFSVK